MAYCVNCLAKYSDSLRICPRCGYDQYAYWVNYRKNPVGLQPFTRLSDGRYVIGRVLGSGGFGVTYKAYDRGMNKPVCIKELFIRNAMVRDGLKSTDITLKQRTRDDVRFQQLIMKSFYQEAKILTKLSLSGLDGVVTMYDFFTANHTRYIAMEYLDGITLDKYVYRKGGKLSYEEVKSKLGKVVRSMQTVHSHGILHGDIKPQNIMVLKDGRMVLFDFGGAKLQYMNTIHGMQSVIYHTEGFSPIEQYTNSNLGPWVDVYAMGATMYYCLTGLIPQSAVERRKKDTLKSFSELHLDLPESAWKIVSHCMALDWKKRYRSMWRLSLAFLWEKIHLPVIICGISLYLLIVIYIIVSFIRIRFL